jgi:hypothetical protein
MELPFPSETILRPSFISMAAAFLSFSAWLFPSFGVLRKGFEHPSPLSSNSLLILGCWYLLIFVTFSIGEMLGRLRLDRRDAPRSGLFNLESNLLYYSVTLLATIGTAATLVRIFQLLSLQQAIAFMVLGQANELKFALYEDYSIGFVSLRYVVLFSAALALYRMVRLRSFSPLNLLNMLLLAASTFLLGSRLIFVATLLTLTLLLTFQRNRIHISISKTLTTFAVLFLILSLVNFVRNKNYYDANKLPFVAAGVSEILTYLGSSTQAAIGSAAVVDQLVAGGDQTYRNYVDEEEVLNTNSAFVHLHEQMGFYSWPYIALMCLFMGFVFEFLKSFGKTIFLLPAGAILYGSAELWRLDLFHQGIFVVWFVIGIGLPALLIVCQRFCTFTFGSARVTEPS